MGIGWTEVFVVDSCAQIERYSLGICNYEMSKDGAWGIIRSWERRKKQMTWIELEWEQEGFYEGKYPRV